MLAQPIESFISSMGVSPMIDGFIVIIAITFIAIIAITFIVAIIAKRSDRAHDFTQYVPILLTSLGILGTFCGIVAGLLGIDANNIGARIGSLLEGMKIAFTISLVGMISSIIYKVLASSGMLTPKGDDVIEEDQIDTHELYTVMKDQIVTHELYTAVKEQKDRMTDLQGISLPMSVFFANESYTYSSEPFTISATTLLRPVRQIILSQRVSESDREVPVDASSRLASEFGTALHDSVKAAWTGNNLKAALISLGHPERIADKVIVNPEENEDLDGKIPVYFEQRSSRKCGRWTVTGNFDMVIEGQLRNIKSAGVYTYVDQTYKKQYAWQGSLYRWLNPEIITQDSMFIDFLFKDWKQSDKGKLNYPQAAVLEQEIPLMSVKETDWFVSSILSNIETYKHKPDNEIPECRAEELWVENHFYKPPAQTDGRSTKNFDDWNDAVARLASEGSGIVVPVSPKVRACAYCPASSICEQYKRLNSQGFI
jgi:hypothetical protein